MVLSEIYSDEIFLETIIILFFDRVLPRKTANAFSSVVALAAFVEDQGSSKEGGSKSPQEKDSDGCIGAETSQGRKCARCTDCKCNQIGK